jgi:hypothetical protein
MSPNLQNRNAPSKNCSVSGCDGMMHRRQEMASAPRNQEGSGGAIWVCDTDPTHTEAVTAGEQ